MTDEAEELLNAARKAFARPFSGVIRLEPEPGPVLWVDGRGDSVAISATVPQHEQGAGLCVWRAPRETLVRIFESQRLLTSAYVSGRLIIAGDMSIMARLHLESGS